jgi:hypothetical protein
MAANLDKSNRWKTGISQSVDMYNDWFMKFAPSAFRTTRIQTTQARAERACQCRRLNDCGANPGLSTTNVCKTIGTVLSGWRDI